MKKTRVITMFMAAAAAVAFTLSQAQAAARANTNTKGQSMEGMEWSTPYSWWKDNQDEGKIDNINEGYHHFAFYGEEHPDKELCTITTTYVRGQYRTKNLKFFIGQELKFDASSGKVYVVDLAAQEGSHKPGLFVLGRNGYDPVTLKLTKDDTTTNERIFAFSNFATWNGTILVGDGITFNIGREKQTATVADATNTITDASVLTLEEGATFNLRRDLNANKTLQYWVMREYNVDEYDKETTGKDYFKAEERRDWMTVVTFTDPEKKGGTITNVNNHKITQGTREFILQTNDDEGHKGLAINYDDYEVMDGVTFYKGTEGTNVAVSTLQETSKNTLTTVELSAGTLTADALVSTVNATGGRLAFEDEGDVEEINVKGDITVSGDTNPEGKTYNIDPGKKITFEDDLEMQGVSFVGEGGTKVTIQNTSGNTLLYDLNQGGALLSASSITMSSGAGNNVTVGNRVSAATIANENAADHTLTLGNGAADVEHVLATGGDLIFHNMGEQAITLQDMTIGGGKQVEAYQGGVGDITKEASLNISTSLSAGGGSLLADLELQPGSLLNLDGTQMYLGGTLTLNPGLIQLDEATLAAIRDLENIGDQHDLIYAYKDTTLSYIGVKDGDWAGRYFNLTSIPNADFQIVANDNVFAIKKVSDTPEPTTGTLSLLSLASLCVRRRRK